jgi:hypothetical protein
MDTELDALTSEGKKTPSLNTKTDSRTTAELNDTRTVERIRQQLWYRLAIQGYSSWTGKGIEPSRTYVESMLVPLYIQFESASLLPDQQTLKDVFGLGPRKSKRKYDKAATSAAKAKKETRNDILLFQQMLPLALACSCLTAFILPLYDGTTIYILRWIMTLVSTFIGPRLTGGVYPSFGVLILGLMVNKPLAVCTIALGMWASFFLALVMTKALGIRPRGGPTDNF